MCFPLHRKPRPSSSSRREREAAAPQEAEVAPVEWMEDDDDDFPNEVRISKEPRDRSDLGLGQGPSQVWRLWCGGTF